jgi:hypothetical protein
MIRYLPPDDEDRLYGRRRRWFRKNDKRDFPPVTQTPSVWVGLMLNFIVNIASSVVFALMCTGLVAIVAFMQGCMGSGP